MTDNLEILKSLQRERGLKIIDSHVHPLDVMNAISMDQYTAQATHLLTNQNQPMPVDNFTEVDFPSQLRHNFLEKVILSFGFKFLPSIIKEGIEKIYGQVGSERAMGEMNYFSLDRMVFLPVEPYCTLEDIQKIYPPQGEFIYLVSPDFELDMNSMVGRLETQAHNSWVKGIKIHPNIQGIDLIKNRKGQHEKLEQVFSIAHERGLYILFHGGRSNFLPRRYQRPYAAPQLHFSRKYSTISCFLKSPILNRLFDKYPIPVVIAHLGAYGCCRLPRKRISRLLSQYPQISLDTSGVSSAFIAQALKRWGSRRLIYGSDAFYGKSVLELAIAMEGIRKACRAKGNDVETLEEAAKNIFHRNYMRLTGQ